MMKEVNNKQNKLKQMGADCSKSYQAEISSPQYPKQLAKFNASQNGTSINIYAFTVSSPAADSPTPSKNIVYYNTTLSTFNYLQATSTATFIPRVGFKKQNIESQQNDYHIQFQLHKPINNKTKLQIKTLSGLKLWKKIPTEGLIIEEGNQISIGSHTVRLRHLLTSQAVDNHKRVSSIKLTKCNDDNAQCRICLQKAEENCNPLIMPCNCTGSVSAVHQVCLSDWIFGQKVVFNGSMKSFRFKIKHGQCQICNHSFENYIWNRIMIVLSEFPGTFAILQLKNIMDKQQKTKDNRDYFIYKFHDENKKIRIGNWPDCELYFADNMMSSVNTILEYNEGKIVAKEGEHKFGTYIYTSSKYLSLNSSYRMLNLFFTVKGNNSLQIFQKSKIM